MRIACRVVSNKSFSLIKTLFSLRIEQKLRSYFEEKKSSSDIFGLATNNRPKTLEYLYRDIFSNVQKKKTHEPTIFFHATEDGQALEKFENAEISSKTFQR